jgi:A/G-specific adenine glycosylase
VPIDDIAFFREKLLEWFDIHQRSFPWRKEGLTRYEVIISEILLQRTKAETVAKYFPVFLRKYPDWEALIKASTEDLEEILRPLGLYKHRAKRLFRIIEEYKEKSGILPENTRQLQESNLSTLYISNAYELFILNKKSPLLDVNMARVFGRYFSTGEVKDVRHEKELQSFSKRVVRVKRCKELNWAILDFAALVCKPKKPDCRNCPLSSRCRFYKVSRDARNR